MEEKSCIKIAKCYSLFSYLESHMYQHYKSLHEGGGVWWFCANTEISSRQSVPAPKGRGKPLFNKGIHSYSSFLHLVTSPSDFVRAPHLLNSSSKANFNFWAIFVLIFLYLKDISYILIFWFLMIALAIVFDNYGSSTTMVVAL